MVFEGFLHPRMVDLAIKSRIQKNQYLLFAINKKIVKKQQFAIIPLSKKKQSSFPLLLQFCFSFNLQFRYVLQRNHLRVTITPRGKVSNYPFGNQSSVTRMCGALQDP